MENIKSHSNIFLGKSYEDTWNDYQYSLSSARAVMWNWIVITASNEKQAGIYRMQITERVKNKSLPERTKYAVVSDPDGKRVGSGGATLNVLKYICENSDISIERPLDSKILVIHSGGDTKRIPQYSACGKLFSPVPKLLSDGRRSTLFDELIISVASMPSRMNNGMLVMSGDALLLFNALQVDLRFNRGAVALSTKETAEVGINHGVFLCGKDRYVRQFLHKQPRDVLEKIGAVDENGYVDLDTGMIWLESNMLNSLYSLISRDGTVDSEKFDRFVNESVRISFYGDFLYPLGSNSTYDEYMNQEGEVPLNSELLECRKQIWNVLNRYKLLIIRMSPAKFIHFGTTYELHELISRKITQYDFLNWNKNILTNITTDRYAVNNSYISVNAYIGNNCCIEDCYIGEGVTVGENSILSSINIANVIVPANVVMHCLQVDGGKYVARIYGLNDNPKLSLDGSFLCGTPGDFTDRTGVKSSNLWNMAIYPVCDTVEEAVEQALIVYKISNGAATQSELSRWKEADKTSLEQSFQAADVESIFAWRKELENIIRTEQFVQALADRIDISEAISILSGGNEIVEQMNLLFDKASSHNYFIKMRIYLALSHIMKTKSIGLIKGLDCQHLEDMGYDTLNREINGAMQKTILAFDKSLRFVKDEVILELPARIDFGGGWSDTPPYCVEQGGTVINAAVSLNGKLPIRVVVRKLPEKIVWLESVDLDHSQAFTETEQLLNYSNLNDAFVIIKAALVITGIISHGDASLDDTLERLGGGMYISISTDIPKGSGLGTSSILAGGCIRAISEIFGVGYDIDTIYSLVVCLEQLIGTCGGWQDQAGGLTNGIKMIKSQPGTVQKLDVEYVDMAETAMDELRERYVLVYSGQQRLAKNILREVMSKYVLSDKKVLAVLYEIQRIAVLMKFELEKGNITAFGELLSHHLELSKRLDDGSTNTCIDQIFDVCNDLVDGKCICGAGGGGFLQVILKKGVSKGDLRKRLSDVFRSSGVEVWDCEFV